MTNRGVLYSIICKVQRALNKIKINKCASGSGVEYNLAKVGVASSEEYHLSAETECVISSFRCGKIVKRNLILKLLKNIAF